MSDQKAWKCAFNAYHAVIFAIVGEIEVELSALTGVVIDTRVKGADFDMDVWQLMADKGS